MNNFRQINRNLFCGGGWEDVYKDAESLEALGIDSVLDLQYLPNDPVFNRRAISEIKEILEHYNIDYWAVPMFDGPENENLEDIFEEGFHAIDAWLADNKRAKILVKCALGLSRGPAMIIYYLCKEKKLEYQQAYSMVASPSRTGLYIDNAFKDFLKEKFPL